MLLLTKMKKMIVAQTRMAVDESKDDPTWQLRAMTSVAVPTVLIRCLRSCGALVSIHSLLINPTKHFSRIHVAQT